MLGSVYACGACPYLPDKSFRVFMPQEDMRAHYRVLMDVGFRRNGDMIYHTHCEDCQACQSTRVAIPLFKMRQDQKRCWKRNQDLQISITAIGQDREHQALFSAYEAMVHRNEDAQIQHLAEDWCIQTDSEVKLSTIPSQPKHQHGLEIQARNADGQLVAVTIMDVFADAVSSVYCYYDPTCARRGLGTFMALQEIDYCRQQGMQWLYLGFYVAECPKLAYKARFQPLQIYRHQQWQWFHQLTD